MNWRMPGGGFSSFLHRELPSSCTASGVSPLLKSANIDGYTSEATNSRNDSGRGCPSRLSRATTCAMLAGDGRATRPARTNVSPWYGIFDRRYPTGAGPRTLARRGQRDLTVLDRGLESCDKGQGALDCFLDCGTSASRIHGSVSFVRLCSPHCQGGKPGAESALLHRRGRLTTRYRRAQSSTPSNVRVRA